MSDTHPPTGERFGRPPSTQEAEDTPSENVALEADIAAVDASEIGARPGLSVHEIERLQAALQAVWSIPFVGDIRDFVWEAIFHHVKGLPIPDPSTQGTSKQLFDVVDKERNIGWSQKALQWNKKSIEAHANVEFVIQRADIFKPENARILGHPEGLGLETPEPVLGRALVTFWKNKVERDKRQQNVVDGFVGILLKNRARTEYVYFEHPVPLFDELNDPGLYQWRWTDSRTKQGLQAIRRADNRVALRWYPNQKQVFECLALPENPVRLSLIPRRMDASEFDAFISQRVTMPVSGQVA